MLRLRMDQDLQRSVVWLGEATAFVPGLLILSPMFFAQSSLRPLFFRGHIHFGARVKQEALHVTV